MKRVGVKILLKYGHVLVATATLDEVRQMVGFWKGSKSSSTAVISGNDTVNGEPWEWHAATSEVVAIHTFDLRTLAQPQQLPDPWQKRGSGYPGPGGL